MANNLIIKKNFRYGDKVPISFWGRAFAVVWILFGITIISLYVATLTSILTVELQGEKPLLVVGKKVRKQGNNNYLIIIILIIKI